MILVEIREEISLNYRIISKFASIIAAYHCKFFFFSFKDMLSMRRKIILTNLMYIGRRATHIKYVLDYS